MTSLAPGARGPAVVELQRRLTLSGHWTEQDGEYGAETTARVLAYQRARGLPDTGEADDLTLQALRRTSSSATMPAVKPEGKS